MAKKPRRKHSDNLERLIHEKEETEQRSIPRAKWMHPAYDRRIAGEDKLDERDRALSSLWDDKPARKRRKK